MLTWHNPEITPPPERTEILLAVRGERKEATVGYYRSSEGGYILMDDCFLNESAIYAWARLPKPPRLRDFVVTKGVA